MHRGGRHRYAAAPVHREDDRGHRGPTFGTPALTVDGLLVVDKPAGPTSHDVVAAVRRLLHEKRVGHTGTLDPGASGVLALVIGRATRLAQFMSADEKAYDARIRLGVRTDTDDSQGAPVGPAFAGAWPTRAEVEAALRPLLGTVVQRPPAYSAKKVEGRRSYAIARAQARGGSSDAPAPPPVTVSLREASITGCADGIVSLSLRCSAGYYVRALARDLGEGLGTGAHLSGLRRTRSGAATLADARTLADLEQQPNLVHEALVPMAKMLPDLPALTLTEGGMRRTGHGTALDADDFTSARILSSVPPDVRGVRLLAPDGTLVAMARPVPGRGTLILHPFVVLV